MKNYLRVKGLMIIAAANCLVFASHVSADMIDTSGIAAWETCALCHGADGVSVMSKFPRLAGQKSEYLQQQFFAFRQGHRDNDGGQMQAISAEVSEAEIDNAITYFARLAPPPAKTIDDELVSDKDFQALRNLGEAVFTQGSDTVVACRSCHGQTDSSAPWLDGQHADYLQKQLVEFKNGDRKPLTTSDEMDEINMSEIAASLSPQEIAGVSLYLETVSLRDH